MPNYPHFIVYIAGPFRAPTPYGIKLNVDRAEHYASQVAQLGIGFDCPHLNSCHFQDLSGTDDTFWLEMTLEKMRRCDAVLRIPGRSSGADAEVREAEERRIPVVRVDDCDCDAGDSHLGVYPKTWQEKLVQLAKESTNQKIAGGVE